MRARPALVTSACNRPLKGEVKMIRIWTLAAVAACSLLPVAAAAQDTPRPRPRTRVQAGPFGAFTFTDSRGRIGVVVKTDADAAEDKVGARIEAVTPSGPADKAG